MLEVQKKFLIIGLIFTIVVLLLVLTGNAQPASFEVNESKMQVNLVLSVLSAVTTGMVLYQQRNSAN